MPILAELHRAAGSRFVPLANRLGFAASRQGDARALIAAGLVMRNPGYGHPLRPEYVLTPRGYRIAPACVRLVEALQRLDFEDGGLKKWSIPVLLELARERRFADSARRSRSARARHARPQGARGRGAGGASRAHGLPAVDERSHRGRGATRAASGLSV